MIKLGSASWVGRSKILRMRWEFLFFLGSKVNSDVLGVLQVLFLSTVIDPFLVVLSNHLLLHVFVDSGLQSLVMARSLRHCAVIRIEI